MSLNEGYGYVMGGLGRDWETKTITAKGQPTTIYTTSLAYQPNKDDQTTWVNLTVWPDRDGSDAPGVAVAAATGKGARVIVRGVLKPSEWVSRDGEKKHGWNMSVWAVATGIRPPRPDRDGSGGDRAWRVPPAKPPTPPAYDPDQEPF